MKEDENGSKYFLNVEKSHQSNSSIKKLKSGEGQMFTNNSDILKEAHRFYSELYISNNIPYSEVKKLY